MRSRSPSLRLTLGLLALIAVCAAGATLAATSIPDAHGVIHACRKAKNGRLRVASSAKRCRGNERALKWNVRGPEGEPGPAISDIAQLDGIACSVDGSAGTVDLAWNPQNEAVLECDTENDGAEAILRINEFSTGVEGAAADEFVELANVGNGAADVGGYKVAYRSATGSSDVTLATIPEGTTIPAGGFYLLGGSAYSGSAAADQSFSGGLASAGGGLGLRDATGALVDSVGWGDGTTNVFVESHPAPAPPATAAPGSSDVRIPDGHDTNDNAADFSVSAVPTPGATNQ